MLVLTEIAGRWSPAQRTMPLALAADIVSSVEQPYGDLDPHVTYSCEIARLRALGELGDRPLDLGAYPHEETRRDTRHAEDSDHTDGVVVCPHTNGYRNPLGLA